MRDWIDEALGRGRRSLEWWIAVVRLAGAAFAALQVGLTTTYPHHYAEYAWSLTGGFAVGAVVLFWLAQNSRTGPWLGVVAMSFDFVLVSGFTLLYSYEAGTPTRQLLNLLVIEGATRWAVEGGLALSVTTAPIAALFEWLRQRHFHVAYRVDFVTFQVGAEILIALLVGSLVARLAHQRLRAEQRAAEAESLRDELGRRADLLDAANRCARALGSSLDFDSAFEAFIRELRGLLRFDRVAIVLVEDMSSRLVAAAGAGADEGLPRGTTATLENDVLGDLVKTGQPIYRPDMSTSRYAEEERLVALGIRCRIVAPLLIGARTIGALSVSRRDADSFAPHEIELVTLLGRLAASAVQNIRAYEGERRTVEELRRLSALRADFVSLVSHELRTPMAAVIGAARTLEQRWRELQPGQRAAFLSLIGDETARLAALIGDVLDTSRIDAGTFTYRFRDVDIEALVSESVATASLAQDEVPVAAKFRTLIPPVRGDAERLRQVLANLIENAVKYSPAGSSVEVEAEQRNGAVRVSVHDDGPGIASVDHRLIFEKFGRVAGASKPGTGLGLYIARSIAEAHGGRLEVSSSPGRGATFTLDLPLD